MLNAFWENVVAEVRKSERACLVEMVKEKIDTGVVQNPGVADMEIDLKTEW